MTLKYGKCPYCKSEVSTNGISMHVKMKHPDEYEEFRTRFEEWKKTTTVKKSTTKKPATPKQKQEDKSTKKQKPAKTKQKQKPKSKSTKKQKPAVSTTDTLQVTLDKVRVQLKSASEKTLAKLKSLYSKIKPKA